MSGQNKKKKGFPIKNISLAITTVLFIVLFGAGSIAYDNFLSFSTFFNLFNDNAYLIIASIGITFVLLTGGIDISIASTIAFTCVFSAFLLRLGWSPFIVIPLVLLIGLAFGALMGYMIHYFKLQPFIVTLAGQFFMRGMCAVISTESIPISDEFYKTMALTKITLLGGRIYFYVFIALAVLLVSLFVLKFTRFGRTVYAVGGNAAICNPDGLASCTHESRCIRDQQLLCGVGWRGVQLLHPGRLLATEHGSGTRCDFLLRHRRHPVDRRRGQCGWHYGRCFDPGCHPDHRDLSELEHLVDKGDDCSLVVHLHCYPACDCHPCGKDEGYELSGLCLAEIIRNRSE